MTQQNAYEIARAGGRHAGLLRNYQEKDSGEIARALRSYEGQVALHRQKLNTPERFVRDWASRSVHIQAGLLRHWQEDLARNQQLAEVMRGLLLERGISHEGP